jgi:hypothetical protein
LPSQPSLGSPHTTPNDKQVEGAQLPDATQECLAISSLADCDDHAAQVVSRSVTTACESNAAPVMSV